MSTGAVSAETGESQVEAPSLLTLSGVQERPLEVVLDSSPTLVWLEVRGFRSFGTQVCRLTLDAPLVVIHADNSQGKTSLAEAVEFLVTGTSSRRDMLGGASSEYHGSLRNAHLPAGDDDVYVAAGVRGPDGTIHVVRRELTGDYAHGSPCRSHLTIDAQPQAHLASVGLEASDPPISAPVLLQHTLRYVLSATPKDRVAFFKALLDLTDLDRLRSSINQARARMEQAPQGPALRALAALAGTPAADITVNLQALEVDKLDDESAAVAVTTVFVDIAQRLTGVASADLPELAEDLAAAATDQREGAFALAPFQSGAQVPAAPAPVNLSSYVGALAVADRNATALVPIITAVLRTPGYGNLTEAVDCPVCATPEALSPERLEILREQVRRTGEVEAAVVGVGRQLGTSKGQAQRLPAEVAASIPATATWTESRMAAAAAAMETLGLERGPLDEALRTSAQVATAAADCVALIQALVTALGEVETAVQRYQDVSEGATAVREELSAALIRLRAARDDSDMTARALAAVVTPAVVARAMTPGLTQLQAAVDQAGSLVAELRAQATHRAALSRLARADAALESAASAVLDARFAKMSTAITRWWLTVRPEELVSFDGVHRRASGQMFVNLVALLRTDVDAEPIRRDALGVYSDSQLNALGLATFLARAQLLKAPVLVLDDPIPGSDGDHRATFAQHTLEALLADGRQVILTTFDRELADLANRMHRHRALRTYRLSLINSAAGTEATIILDAFRQYMAEGEGHIKTLTTMGRRAACGSFRSAAERLAKQIIATARTHGGQATTIDDVHQEAFLLGKLVPLVHSHVIDSAEKGKWDAFATILNPGNHDDIDVPEVSALKMVRRNLWGLLESHTNHWDRGLLQ